MDQLALTQNVIYVHKIGETGLMLETRLRAAGVPIDLSGWTLTLNVRTKGFASKVANAACVPDIDQSWNEETETGGRGIVRCLIDSGFNPITNPDDYYAEYKLVNTGVVPNVTRFIPKDPEKDATYFVFRAQKSLG